MAKGKNRDERYCFFLLVGAGLFLFFRVGKHGRDPVTTQDLIDYRTIHDNGVCELHGLRFRLVIEVEPINESLKSYRERQALWLGFRNLVQSINIPFSFKIETRFLDLREYLGSIRANVQDQGALIKDYGNELADWLNKKSENRQNRDRRCYIILKNDPATISVTGVKSGNPWFDGVLAALSEFRKSGIPDEKMRKTAMDELLVVSGVVMSQLEGMDIKSRQLDRNDLLEMIYCTFNRDMAPYCRLDDAVQKDMFSIFMTSSTPDIFLEEMDYEVTSVEKENTGQSSGQKSA